MNATSFRPCLILMTAVDESRLPRLSAASRGLAHSAADGSIFVASDD